MKQKNTKSVALAKTTNCARSKPASTSGKFRLLGSRYLAVEKILNRFPEVIWDRWTGDIHSKRGIGVFGWIDRADGKADFIFLRIDDDGAWLMVTSSAQHSQKFSKRLGFTNHTDCKRVEHHFPSVKSIKL